MLVEVVTTIILVMLYFYDTFIWRGEFAIFIYFNVIGLIAKYIFDTF